MSTTRPSATTVIDQLLKSGRDYHRQGALDEALGAYQQVLARSADHPDALYLTGLVLYRQARPGAIDLIERACLIEPQHALAHASLAQILQNQGEHHKALIYFRRAAEINRNNPDVFNGLGLSLFHLGQHKSALAAFETAIRLRPKMAEAYNNMGNLLCAIDQPDSAEQCYLQCLSLRPNFSLACNNLGALYQAQQQPARALKYFNAALKSSPDYAEAHNNLGALWLDRGELEQALEEFTQAGRLQPGFTQASINACMALQNLGRHAEAGALLDEVLLDDPNNLTAGWLKCITSLQVVYDSRQILEASRRNYENALKALLKTPDSAGQFSLSSGIAMQAYLLPYQGHNDVVLQSMAGDFLSRQAQKEPLLPFEPLQSSVGEKIRVGIVSAFFYDHSNWKIPIRGWLEGLAQAYEVFAYHTGVKEDAATACARKMVSHLYSGLSLKQFAQQIRDDAIDVLIYPEVGMHPLTTRLAIQRLAPVQCASWGHPVTTGLPDIDYFISSDLMEPEAAQFHYREKLIRLPGLSFSWVKPDYDGNQSWSREDFGLSQDGPLFLCLQNLSKYLPQHDWILLEIARQLPSAQLVFIDGTAAASAALKVRLRRQFIAAGLKFDQQICFLARQNKDRYHALNRLADVFLDTPEWSGCNSSLEALICDLPVVTLPGKFMRGRHSLAFYRHMDYHTLIARDESHYIELAVRLGSDPLWREAQRQQISQSRHRLEEDSMTIDALVALIPDLLDAHQSNH